MNDYSRGSEWRKWDLHVHTPKSLIASEYGGDTPQVWKKFILALEQLPPEIKIVGINDYISIEGYKKILEYQAHGRLKNLELILPVIELRLKEFVGHRELKRLNYHIIFADRSILSPDQIETQFLNNLKGVAQLDSDFPSSITWGGVITPQTLKDLGRAVYDSIPEAKRQSNPHFLELGFNSINFEITKIKEALGETREANTYLKGKYFKAIGKSEWENFTWEGSINDKKTIINSCDFVFIASEDCNQAKRSKESLHSQSVNDRLLHCSDAHKFCSDSKNTKSKELSHCFTWIKADPTFEGLRQVIWDPEERLRIQERNPSDTKPERTIINYITYKNNEDNEEVVYLNKDLNSIIGIRGSGKSTLLKNIAAKVDEEQFIEKDKFEKLYKLDEFKVFWSDGHQDGGTGDSPKSIFYIPQNYLSSLAYDEGEKAKERDQFLTKLLKKNARFANAVHAYAEFSSNNKLKIEGSIESLLKANYGLIEIADQIKKLGSEKEIKKEIEDKKEEAKKYKGSGDIKLTELEITEYSKAKESIDENKKRISILDQDKEILGVLNKRGADVFIANQEFNRLSMKRQELLKRELIERGNESLTDLIKKEIRVIDYDLKSLSVAITKETTVVKKLEAKIKANKALEELTKELVDLQQIARKINDLTETTKQLKAQRDDSLTKLVEAYFDFGGQQNAIFDTVHFVDFFSFLKINIVTTYDIDELKKFVENNINTRDTDPNIKLENDISTLFSESPEKLSKQSIKKIIEYLLSNKIRIKVEANSVQDVISQLLKNRYEIDYLNSVQTKDSGTHFKDMTGGQKAIALLELIFRFDDEKYPILIDQPEDDLDVGGIATDLVEFIKSEKKERQIIIVSHNASLVICSDTEEILVATCRKVSRGKYKFIYKTGAIEDPNIRESIIDILEGGKVALKLRARKLKFSGEI